MEPLHDGIINIVDLTLCRSMVTCTIILESASLLLHGGDVSYLVTTSEQTVLRQLDKMISHEALDVTSSFRRLDGSINLDAVHVNELTSTNS